MLIGQYKHTIDNKKRLALPAKFRGELGDKVIITKGIEKCLVIYTQKEWEVFSGKLGNLSLAQTEARSFTRYGGLKKDVVICGLSNRLEIWDSEKWDVYNKEAEKGIEEIVSKLGSLGI